MKQPKPPETPMLWVIGDAKGELDKLKSLAALVRSRPDQPIPELIDEFLKIDRGQAAAEQQAQDQYTQDSIKYWDHVKRLAKPTIDAKLKAWRVEDRYRGGPTYVVCARSAKAAVELLDKQFRGWTYSYLKTYHGTDGTDTFAKAVAGGETGIWKVKGSRSESSDPKADWEKIA